MTEESISRRNKLFKLANQTEILNIKLELENLKQNKIFSEELPLIIKRYDAPETLSAFVHENK